MYRRRGKLIKRMKRPQIPGIKRLSSAEKEKLAILEIARLKAEKLAEERTLKERAELIEKELKAAEDRKVKAEAEKLTKAKAEWEARWSHRINKEERERLAKLEFELLKAEEQKRMVERGDYKVEDVQKVRPKKAPSINLRRLRTDVRAEQPVPGARAAQKMAGKRKKLKKAEDRAKKKNINIKEALKGLPTEKKLRAYELTNKGQIAENVDSEIINEVSKTIKGYQQLKALETADRIKADPENFMEHTVPLVANAVDEKLFDKALERLEKAVERYEVAKNVRWDHRDPTNISRDIRKVAEIARGEEFIEYLETLEKLADAKYNRMDIKIADLEIPEIAEKISVKQLNKSLEIVALFGGSVLGPEAFIKNIGKAAETLKEEQLDRALDISYTLAEKYIWPADFIKKTGELKEKLKEKQFDRCLELAERLAEKEIDPDSIMHYGFTGAAKATKGRQFYDVIEKMVEITEKHEIEAAEKVAEIEEKIDKIETQKEYDKEDKKRDDILNRKYTLLNELGITFLSIEDHVKGDAYAKSIEKLESIYVELLDNGFINELSKFRGAGVSSAAENVPNDRFLPELDRLKNLALVLGPENIKVFKYLDKGWPKWADKQWSGYSIDVLERFVKPFKGGELNAINIEKFMSLNPKRTDTFLRFADHKMMQRSRQRLISFGQALSASKKTREKLLDFLEGKEFGKKQIKELPYIAQYMSTYEVLTEKVPRLKEGSLKQLKEYVEGQVIKEGKKKYGKGFEKKIKESIRTDTLHNFLTVLNATSTLEKHYKGLYDFGSRELKLLQELTKLWMEGKEALEEFKYRELEKMGVPQKIAKKWKLPTRLEARIEAGEISFDELVVRANESLGEFAEKRQKELKKEYGEAIDLIINKDGAAQEKIQKLIKKIKKENPVAADHLGWVAGQLVLTSTVAVDAEVTDGLRFAEWLNAGQKFGTCQSWSGGGEENLALVSFLADASKKMIGVYDRKTGELLGRGMMYLTEKEGKWGIYLDDVYYATDEHRINIADFVEQKAKELGIGLFEEPGEFVGKAPHTYANNAGGMVNQKIIE